MAYALVKDLREFYKWADAHCDPRTAEWLFVKDIQTPLGMVVAYLAFVFIGPRIMRNREPFSLKRPMVIYNAAMALLNLYIFLEIILSTTAAGYSYSCQQVKYTSDANELRVAAVLWWFYISKLVEFLDTVFFVLRKKNNQISVLHVYHHSTMVGLWWIGIKWVAGGQSFFSAMVNAFVHIIMYTYYGLSAMPSLRGYLWWKKYLTQFQLAQFCIVMVHGIVSWHQECEFPKWMVYALLGYMISFLVLFLNFYLHAYIMRRNAKKRLQAQQKSAANGVVNEVEEKKKR